MPISSVSVCPSRVDIVGGTERELLVIVVYSISVTMTTGFKTVISTVVYTVEVVVAVVVIIIVVVVDTGHDGISDVEDGAGAGA